jgi:hypothetical protein
MVWAHPPKGASAAVEAGVCLSTGDPDGLRPPLGPAVLPGARLHEECDGVEVAVVGLRCVDGFALFLVVFKQGGEEGEESLLILEFFGGFDELRCVGAEGFVLFALYRTSYIEMAVVELRCLQDLLELHLLELVALPSWSSFLHLLYIVHCTPPPQKRPLLQNPPPRF